MSVQLKLLSGREKYGHPNGTSACRAVGASSAGAPADDRHGSRFWIYDRPCHHHHDLADASNQHRPRETKAARTGAVAALPASRGTCSLGPCTCMEGILEDCDAAVEGDMRHTRLIPLPAVVFGLRTPRRARLWSPGLQLSTGWHSSAPHNAPPPPPRLRVFSVLKHRLISMVKKSESSRQDACCISWGPEGSCSFQLSQAYSPPRREVGKQRYPVEAGQRQQPM
nr:uncharacterized protein LOC128781278 [Desmodus rotundus]